MKTMLIVLFLILPAPSLAQTVKAVEPIRVSISSLDSNDDHDQEVTRLLRDELKQRRNLIMATRRTEYEVFVAVEPITECDGFVAGMLVVTVDGPRLSLHTGRDLPGLARYLSEWLQKKYFKRSN